MKSNKKDQRISVSLQNIDYAALVALAETCDVSLSWLARHAIVQFLERAESQDLQLPLQLKRQLGGDISNG